MKLEIVILFSVFISVIFFIVLVLSGNAQLEERSIPWVLFSISFIMTVVLAVRSIHKEGSLKKDYEAIAKALEKDKLETQITQLDSEKIKKEHRVRELESRLAAAGNEKQAFIKYIRDDLRNEAKDAAQQTILLERASRQEEELIKLFGEWEETKKCITGFTSTVSPKIRDMIEDYLKPRYTLQKNIDNAKSFLLIITTLFGVVSLVRPQIPLLFALPIFGLPIVIMISFMLRNYTRLNPTFREVVRENTPLFAAFSVLVLAISGICTQLPIVWTSITSHRYYLFEDALPMTILIICGLLALFSTLFILEKRRQKARSDTQDYLDSEYT